ncbi:transcription factor TGA7-like isoform X2 [Rutidosis leptorrhynchoides]|uniref:transcription factor TGA7-like isoform X2 n=1 Tax=Rutidosis leptorrhynchoides TaxID=125765 RepID=UPI003A99F5B5
MAPTPLSTQFSTSRRMEIHNPLHQITTWDHDAFEAHISPNTSHSLTTQLDTRLPYNVEYTSQESLEYPRDSETSIPNKMQRRLAQNRETARKSRLKRKAYVQELELGSQKLAKLEREIERSREQAVYMDLSNTIHGLLSGIVTFEKKYELWVIEQQKKEAELVTILQRDISDVELRVFVDDVVNHYNDLFRMKADAAKADVFSLLYGSWRPSVEQLFQWLGGFRPSQILYILMPTFEPLTDTQVVNLSRLRHTCRQAEDALSQGIEKLEQTLAQMVGNNLIECRNYDKHMKSMIEGLEALENFSNQADHLRHRTLEQMSRILTTRQTAKGFVALGEYFQRLRVLNSNWSARPCG